MYSNVHAHTLFWHSDQQSTHSLHWCTFYILHLPWKCVIYISCGNQTEFMSSTLLTFPIVMTEIVRMNADKTITLICLQLLYSGKKTKSSACSNSKPSVWRKPVLYQQKLLKQVQDVIVLNQQIFNHIFSASRGYYRTQTSQSKCAL